MSAERGPSRGGTATLTRPPFSAERGGIRRSVIAGRSEAISSSRLPRRSSLAPRNDGQKIMSRREFSARFAPFFPSNFREQTGNRSPKPQQLITRQFSTYRDGATINRSSIDHAKRKISASIIGETSQNGYTERPKTSLIKKVSLEKKRSKVSETKEQPKVSLVKPVSLEKRRKGIDTKKVSLVKKVNLEKKIQQQARSTEIQNRHKVSLKKDTNTLSFRAEPRNLIPQIQFGKTAVGDPSTRYRTVGMTHPVEQPFRFAEKNIKPKETVVFKAKQRNETLKKKDKPDDLWKFKYDGYWYIGSGRKIVVQSLIGYNEAYDERVKNYKNPTPDELNALFPQIKYEAARTKEQNRIAAESMEWGQPLDQQTTQWYVNDKGRERIIYGSLDQISGEDKRLVIARIEDFRKIIAEQKRKTADKKDLEKDKIKEEEDAKKICFWKDLMKIAIKKSFVEKIDQSVQGKVIKKGENNGKVPGIVTNSINGEVLQAPAKMRHEICNSCVKYLKMNHLKLTIAPAPTQ